MDVLFTLIFLASFGLLLTGLARPKLFKRLFGKKTNRKSIALTFGSAFVISFIALGIVIDPSISSLSIKDNQETLSEDLLIEGQVLGTSGGVRLDDKSLELKDQKFSKQVKLKPGENKFVLSVYKDGEKVSAKTYRVFYDYEGKLFADQKKAEDDALNKKLATIPTYELVRKEKTKSGYSAVIYAEGELEDYLVANLIKDVKKKDSADAISLLVFSISDKGAVEASLESDKPEALATVSSKTKANYEKTKDSEELFYFPAGLEGEKLALEVK